MTETYPEFELRSLNVGTVDREVILSVETCNRVSVSVKNEGSTALNKLSIAMRGHPASQWVTFVNSDANYTTPVAPLVYAANADNVATSAYNLAAGAEVTLYFDLWQFPIAQLRFTATVASGSTGLVFYVCEPASR